MSERETKLPALQFYTGDWLKDPCVRALDFESKGVWIDLLCIMNESTERGRLVLPDGRVMPDDGVARNLGLDEAKWKQIRSKLLAYGVASEDETGTLYNRRMVRDQAKRRALAANGRLGGLAKRSVSKPQAKGEAKASPSVAVSSSKRKVPKEKRWRFVPTGWEPNDGHRELARTLGLDLDAAVALYRDHEFDKPRSDPDRTFNNWLRNAANFGRNGKHPTPDPDPAPPRGSTYLDALEEPR